MTLCIQCFVSQQVKFYINNMVNKKALYIMFLIFETTRNR